MDYSLKYAGRLIRDIRLQKHMTQHELARVAGVDPAVLLRIERGDTIPNLKTVNRLANGLHCQPFIVFQEIEDEVSGI